MAAVFVVDDGGKCVTTSRRCVFLAIVLLIPRLTCGLYFLNSVVSSINAYTSQECYAWPSAALVAAANQCRRAGGCGGASVLAKTTNSDLALGRYLDG